MNQFQCTHRAGYHAGLLSGGSARLAEIRGVGAKVALGSLAGSGFPDSTVRDEGTGFETGLTPDALGFIGSTDVAVGSVDVTGTGRAVGHAEWFGALPADSDLNIVRIAGEDAAGDLNTGEGCAGLPFVDQRAGQHAALTTGALAAVVDQIGGRWGIVRDFGRCGCWCSCGI